jgi:sulfur-oxidizing protein SoxY
MITRRDFLVLACGVASTRVQATSAAVQEAIRKVTGDAPLGTGNVKLDVPALIENGNSVMLSVAVNSPMTATEYVKAIHVFAPQNPLPNVVSVYLGPRSGRARFAARVRVADSQKLMAVAQLSDGSFWSDSADVVVTLPACAEER